jgi:hypothetical protein
MRAVYVPTQGCPFVKRCDPSLWGVPSLIIINYWFIDYSFIYLYIFVHNKFQNDKNVSSVVDKVKSHNRWWECNGQVVITFFWGNTSYINKENMYIYKSCTKADIFPGATQHLQFT